MKERPWIWLIVANVIFITGIVTLVVIAGKKSATPGPRRSWTLIPSSVLLKPVASKRLANVLARRPDADFRAGQRPGNNPAQGNAPLPFS